MQVPGLNPFQGRIPGQSTPVPAQPGVPDLILNAPRGTPVPPQAPAQAPYQAPAQAIIQQTMQNMMSALMEMGVNPSNQNLTIAQNLANYGQPVSQQTLQTVQQALMGMPDRTAATIEAVVVLLTQELPVNSQGVAAIKQLLNGQPLPQQLQQLPENVVGLMQQMQSLPPLPRASAPPSVPTAPPETMPNTTATPTPAGTSPAATVPASPASGSSAATSAPPATTATPAATSAPPAATVTPAATSAPPAATATPAATSAPPATTATPAATSAPPATTATPAATSAPPAATATPVDTSAPPAATATPVATSAPPVATATPAATSAPPAATATPAATSAPPAATATPAATSAPPAATATPAATSAPPAATATPAATSAPPAATATPAATSVPPAATATFAPVSSSPGATVPPSPAGGAPVVTAPASPVSGTPAAPAPLSPTAMPAPAFFVASAPAGDRHHSALQQLAGQAQALENRAAGPVRFSAQQSTALKIVAAETEQAAYQSVEAVNPTEQGKTASQGLNVTAYLPQARARQEQSALEQLYLHLAGAEPEALEQGVPLPAAQNNSADENLFRMFRLLGDTLQLSAHLAENMQLKDYQQLFVQHQQVMQLTGLLEEKIKAFQRVFQESFPLLARELEAHLHSDGLDIFSKLAQLIENNQAQLQEQLKHTGASGEKAVLLDNLRQLLEQVGLQVDKVQAHLSAREMLSQNQPVHCIPLMVHANQERYPAELYIQQDYNPRDPHQKPDGKYPLRLTLTLETHNLGRVSVDMSSLKSDLGINLKVLTRRVKLAVEERLEQLKHQIEQQGNYTLTQLQCTVEPDLETRQSMLLPPKKVVRSLRRIEGVV